MAERLREHRGRWPMFVPEALDAGFEAVYAFPMRLRDDRIGAINMFRRESGAFGDADVDAGQALADVATIGVLSERRIRSAEQRSERLQYALDSRIVIEQAKGALAERAGLDVGEAFERIRRYARGHRVKLRDVCREVIDGRLDP